MARKQQVREAAAKFGPVPVSGEKPVRKNHFLFQSKIDAAKAILGTGTETETLDMALDLVIYGEALAAGVEAMVGEEYNDVLGIGSEIPGAERDAE